MRFDDLRRELAVVEAALESVELSGNTSSLVERKTVVKLQLASVVYPVLTLPGEITSEIFLRCTRSKYPSAKTPPLLFLEICRTWRSIALSTPALWTDRSTGYDANVSKELTTGLAVPLLCRYPSPSSATPKSGTNT
ncbi:hypothetical protein B0H16DRAFT_1420221 [Mycena metata]|uniref:F-box domain-containing protein n=1 Tax=Mycena metata TaxID=1033252 RepID=A0AAD7N908_9AGAR|nr:hypothetical protein B0H16DRAFT_1420221 [Mycena metata]